jgi:HSP20 family molecular chaperone IbpA
MIRVEDYVENDRYVVRADLPGIDPEKDVEVSLDGDVLTISGQRREEDRDKRHSEVRYGAFSRSIRLPAGVSADDVTARYDAGVLEVSMPLPQRSGEQVTVPVQRGESR